MEATTPAEPVLCMSQHGSAVDATHLIHFWVPLPEPLGLPDGYIVECTTPAPLDWVMRNNQAFEESPPPMLLDASLSFHHSSSNAGLAREAADIFRLAATSMDPERRDDDSWSFDRKERNMRLFAQADRSFVEMVIPVVFPAPGEDPLDGSIEAEAGEESDEADSELFSQAFDRGLEYLRDIQRAYYLATRRPLHLVSRSTLPVSVPMAYRALDEDRADWPNPERLSIFMLHQNLGRDVRDELDQDALGHLLTAMEEQSQGGLAARYLEFVREGGVALELDGDTRAAAVFFATAAEVLLDEALAHLLWESAMRPETAAAAFDAQPWLTARVKALYHPRIGGSWDVSSDCPVGWWFVNTSGLRNRVVHAGYEPSLGEAAQARDSVFDLQGFLADRVCAHLETYPRTALALAGRPGLEARGLWGESIAFLMQSSDEVPWRETFVRWRTAMQRSRRESPAYVSPSLARANVVAVLHPCGQVVWVVHDVKSALASRIRESDITNPARQFESLEKFLTALRLERPKEPVSTAFLNASVNPTAALTWIPEYRLVPLAGVMVNRQNFDPPLGNAPERP